MRFTTLFSVVALATVVQATVATAGAVAKGDEVGAKYEVCTTANASSCGTGSECVTAPNSFVPTLAIGLCKPAGNEDPAFNATLVALAASCPTPANCAHAPGVPLACQITATVFNALSASIPPPAGSILGTIGDGITSIFTAVSVYKGRKSTSFS
ncbi:hypothetical protein C8Q74DRAFT_17421 [Fomes fomentarius]|nr:hypothetical protein C8Q74DRAFT_17421 [Fomes fomentarius]